MKMLKEPVDRLCALKTCGKPFSTTHPEQKFCCDAHRTKAWMDANLIRKKPKQDTWAGPRCHCGKPARFDGFCGHHNLARRRDKAAWRKVFQKMMERYTLEHAREIVNGESSTGC